MQLKLLNFHKILSSFATNIVGAFVALIIYQACGSFTYSFLWLVGDHTLRIIYNACLYKFYTKYPQLALLLRIVPILISTLSVLLLDVSLIAGVLLILFFHPMTISYIFKNSWYTCRTCTFINCWIIKCNFHRKFFKGNCHWVEK